jgi:hypothetical protein
VGGGGLTGSSRASTSSLSCCARLLGCFSLFFLLFFGFLLLSFFFGLFLFLYLLLLVFFLLLSEKSTKDAASLARLRSALRVLFFLLLSRLIGVCNILVGSVSCRSSIERLLLFMRSGGSSRGCGCECWGFG